MIPDDFFAHPSPTYPRALRDRLHAAWRRAQRFSFSDDASKVAGRLAFEAPELVINHRQFAIAPYPTTYIEMNSRAFFDAGVAAGIKMLAHGYPEENRDLRIGYLIDGAAIYGFSETPRKRAEYALTPFVYWTAPPGDQPPLRSATVRFGDNPRYISGDGLAIEMEGERSHRVGKFSLLLGTASNTTAAQLAMDDILRANEIEPLMPLRGINMSGWYGDIRNVWTLLLWLNQPARIGYTDVPPSRRIRSGKLRHYSAFRTVEIELGRYRSITRAYLLGAPRTPPRLHQVRGSFHHHGGQASGCGHTWPLEPDVDGIWQCSRCGRKRWWVRSHQRGDESRGVVVHDYDVKTPEEPVPNDVHNAA